MDLFDDLKARGVAAMAEIVEMRLQEGSSVEFKEKCNVKYGKFDREDKKNLGKTISAFSNSNGGVLIFGVKAGPDDEGVDCAQALRPINEISRFLSEATTLIGEYLQPKNENIEVYAVKDKKPSHGFLAIRVARSDRRPHRSEAPGDGKYYKRVGCSSYPMEHYDIEDAFARRIVPEITLRWRVQTAGGGSVRGLSYKNIAVILSLQNVGLVSALYSYLSLSRVSGIQIDEFGLDGNGSLTFTRRRTKNRTMFGGGADDNLHPGQVLDIVQFKMRVTRSTEEIDRSYSQIAREVIALRDVSASFHCEFGCKDLQVQNESVVIDHDRLLEAFGE